jgi:hypothetical protein
MPGAPQIARVQWPNQNALRRYPLAISADGVAIGEKFQIPTSTFVDALIVTTFASKLHFAGFFISQLTIGREAFQLAISHVDEALPVATVFGPMNLTDENQVHTLRGINTLSGTRGYLVTGDLKPVAELPPGTYSFTHQNAAFDPGVISCGIRAIQTIGVEVSGSNVQELSGKVVFRAATGTQFRKIEEENRTVILWDAIGNSDLQSGCECEDSELNPIYTVGGLPGDETGAINIFGSRCLEVQSESAGINLTNSCSEPCCDCAEDDGLNERLDLLYSQILTMETRIATLESKYSQVDALIEEASCDDVQCPPYDPETDGPLIDSFKLSDLVE